MQLSKSFSLEEMISSQTAARRGLNNKPNQSAIQNLTTLCNKILQPTRDKFGAIRISSGYRSIAVNKAVGGSSTSDHCLGFAADIIPLESSKKEVAIWMAKTLSFHQLIMEFGTDRYNPSWIHISCNPKNAKQILWATGSPTRYVPVNL
jgi:hypothetical protein